MGVVQRSGARPRWWRSAALVLVVLVVLAIGVGVLAVLRPWSDAAPSRCGGDRSVVATTRSGGHPGASEIVLVTADGAATPILPDWVATDPSFDPEGEQLVVVRAESNFEGAGPRWTDLWTVDADGTPLRALTSGARALAPDWSPAHDRIVYVEFTGGAGTELRILQLDGGGQPETLLVGGDAQLLAPEWSPGGDTVAYVRRTTPAGRDTPDRIELVGADGLGRRVVTDVFDVQSLAWHPDGDSILVSTLSGRSGQVVLVDVESGVQRVVATAATSATWASTGDSIYYSTTGGPPEEPQLRLAEGQVEGGRVSSDRLLGDLEGVVDTATRPCRSG